MPKITYIDFEGTARTVEGEIGSTVMETAIKNNIPGIEAECGGACACATCHVHVDEAWRAVVGEPSPMEEDMLDFGYDVQPNSRLSCQIKVSEALEGLVVRTPERQAWYRRFEVPTPVAANSIRNFKSKSGTRIIGLLVPLCFRSSWQSVLRRITNFGNGPSALRRVTDAGLRHRRWRIGGLESPLSLLGCPG